VEGLAITGSVAVDNAKLHDDVDFMVVAAPRRLWLVRPLLLLFSQFYGKRRTWRGEEQNSWCFNLWLEPASLRIALHHHSLYTAYEVGQVDWLIEKQSIRTLFFQTNTWSREYIPFFFDHRSRVGARFLPTQIASLWLRHALARKVIGVIMFVCLQLVLAFVSLVLVPICVFLVSIIEYLLDVANFVAYHLQHIYMRRHMTREVVRLDFAAFHPRDTRARLIEKMITLFEIVPSTLMSNPSNSFDK
jgi:hypothetical protein